MTRHVKKKTSTLTFNKAELQLYRQKYQRLITTILRAVSKLRHNYCDKVLQICLTLNEFTLKTLEHINTTMKSICLRHKLILTVIDLSVFLYPLEYHTVFILTRWKRHHITVKARESDIKQGSQLNHRTRQSSVHCTQDMKAM